MRWVSPTPGHQAEPYLPRHHGGTWPRRCPWVRREPAGCDPGPSPDGPSRCLWKTGGPNGHSGRNPRLCPGAPGAPRRSLPEVSPLAGVGAGRAHAAHRRDGGGPQGDADEPALLKQSCVVVGIGALARRGERHMPCLGGAAAGQGMAFPPAPAIPLGKWGHPHQLLSQSGSLSPDPWAAPALAHLCAPRGLLALPLLAEAGQLPGLSHLLVQHAEQDQHSQALRGEML